ncbi:MAG: hypothetical protein U0X73_08435 [Thermoanaerobaculia bacterium]
MHELLIDIEAAGATFCAYSPIPMCPSISELVLVPAGAAEVEPR